MARFQNSFLAKKHPLLFAHRGASYELPENTIPAFHRALKYGVDVFEIDVRLTADDHLVVAHDPDVLRMTGQPGIIRKMKLAALKKLNAGYSFPGKSGDFPLRTRPIQIPTLEELVGEFPNMWFNIDLKDTETRAADVLWRVIQEKNLPDQVIVGSFNHSTLAYLRRITRGKVSTSATKREVWLLAGGFVSGTVGLFPLKMDALQLPTRHGRVDLIQPRIIEAAHRRNLAVHYWTINDPNQMRLLLERGADGIMTDDPGRLAAVFHEWVAR